MSFNEKGYNDGDTSSGLEKKRRIQRECDIYRTQKSMSAQFQVPSMV